jgi:hypothetical protein
VVHPSNGLLTKPRAADSSATVSGLLSRLRTSEAQWAAERGALQLAVKEQRQRAQQAAAAARRAEEQRDFRLGEVRHLKEALKRRDDVIVGLQDTVRELEVGVAAADATQRAEGESTQRAPQLPQSWPCSAPILS